MPYAGEIAALLTAFLWSWTAIFFTAAGRKVGSEAVNIIRLTGGMILLFIASLALVSTEPGGWFKGGRPGYLFLSGLIGLALGDSALFRSMVLFGPRRATLVMSVVPILTSFFAWFTLGERLSATEWAAVILTVSGVFWVVLEEDKTLNGESTPRSNIIRGLILGLVAALCQSIGLILAKAGMADGVEPVAATFLRMLAGWIGMMVAVTLRGTWPSVAAAFQNSRGMLLIGAGTIVGPFLGVWLSLVAIKYAETGVAATLMGLMPIMVIPWVWLIYKERISPRAWIGTLLAVLGASLLFR